MLRHLAAIFITSLVFAASAWSAEAGLKVLSFQQWKESQTLAAKNRLARESNKLVVAKANNKTESELAALSKEVSVAENAMEISNDYTIEDYFLVYLMGPEMESLADHQEILRAAAKMMSPDEVTEIMKIWMKSLRPQASGATTSKVGSLKRRNSWVSSTP